MSTSASASFDWRQGWRYGLMGLPLAFVALPLYVQLPNYYAKQFGMPLATLGAVLLGARLFDAFIDPLLGRWSDRLYAQSLRSVLAWGAVACALLALGFGLLFFPPLPAQQHLVHLGQRGAADHLCGLQRCQRAAPVLGRHAGR